MQNLASERTHYTRANPNPNPPQVFENPNLIPRILRRKESSVSPQLTLKSSSYLVRWIYLEDLPFDEYFGNSFFRTSSDSKLVDLVQDPEFIWELEIWAANFSIERYLQNSPQFDLTIEATPNPFVITSVSIISSSFPHIFQPQSTPHQTITSSSPSTTQTSIVIPTSAFVSPLPTVMANRYAPMVLPANLCAMPQDYQSKITTFDGTGTYTAQQHTKKMTEYFEIYEIDTLMCKWEYSFKVYLGKLNLVQSLNSKQYRQPKSSLSAIRE